MGICQADNISDNQIDNQAIYRIEQPCNEIIFGNETSIVENIGIFSTSGLFLNTDVTSFVEDIGIFRASGISLNTDITVSNETIGLFSVSGVMLITGTF
jgi:hypothetical protein